MNTKEMVCVVCPMGCRMTVSVDGKNCSVEGNKCDRGKKYAFDEMTNPLRTVTSSVKIVSAEIRRLPVKTVQAFPKGKMFELMGILKQVEVKSPVKMGDVILPNALGTGIDVVASRSVK
jgi:CxxC motif-containing protein